MTLALFGSKALAFLKQVPIWVWIVIVFLLTLQWTKVSSYRKGKDDALDETRLKQAQTKAAVNERATAIINEEKSHADEAIDARDNSPSFPASDVVPDKVGRIIFRD
jgi:hypothetical protein